MPQRPFDLDKAKFHFQKSGIGNTAVPLYASPAAPGSVEMGVLLQEAAQKIGLNIDLKHVPADGYWSNYWMKQPFGFGAINPRPSADILLTLFFKSRRQLERERLEEREVRPAARRWPRAESDEAKRKQHYCDIQAHHQGSLRHRHPGVHHSARCALDEAQGLKPIPVGGLMGNAFAEHVWLEA